MQRIQIRLDAIHGVTGECFNSDIAINNNHMIDMTKYSTQIMRGIFCLI